MPQAQFMLITTLPAFALAAALAAPLQASDPVGDPVGDPLLGPIAAPEIAGTIPLDLSTRPARTLTSRDEEASAAEEGGQDAVSKAMDSTATQWSFQLAYQAMPNYYNDTMSNGVTRPDGDTDYVQLRVVAPVPKSDAIPFTMLPRLTLRHYENAAGDSGMGQTELFVLGIAQDWGSGRWGIGPLVNFPGSSTLGADEWGYGLAGAIVNSTSKWYYGVLLTQAWYDRTPNMPQRGGASPLGIAPFLNYQLGDGWYVGNGDMVARWSWDESALYMPIGVRLGKVLVSEKSSWNFYLEYQTSLIYDDWIGPAVQDSIRINATYTMPVGM